jgi:non-ribosomal peptide synthetase component F
MANSDAHNNDPLPQALIGRGGGIRGNQHLLYPQDSPHANMLATILERAGVPDTEYDGFADSTGPLSEA